MRTLTAFATVAVLFCCAHELAAQGGGGGFGGGSGFGGGGGGGGGFGGGPVPPRERALRPSFTATVLRLRLPASMMESVLADRRRVLSQKDVNELLAAGEVSQIVRAATPDGGISWQRTTTYISGFSSVVTEYAVGWQPEISECKSRSAMGLRQRHPTKTGRKTDLKTDRTTDLVAMAFDQTEVLVLEEQAVGLPTSRTRVCRTDLVTDTEDGPAVVNKVEVRSPDSSSAAPELKVSLPHETESPAEYLGPTSGGEVIMLQRRMIDTERGEITLTWSQSSDPLKDLAKPDASDVSFSLALEAEVLSTPVADFLASAALWSATVDAATVASLRRKAKTLWRGGGVVSLGLGARSLQLERETSMTYVSGLTAIVAGASVGWQPETGTAKRKSSLRVELLGRTKADEAILRVLSLGLTEGGVSRTADVPTPAGGGAVQIGLPEETEWEVENAVFALGRWETLVLVFGLPARRPGETSPAKEVALFLLTAR